MADKDEKKQTETPKATKGVKPTLVFRINVRYKGKLYRAGTAIPEHLLEDEYIKQYVTVAK